jgi:hypothetical protein
MKGRISQQLSMYVNDGTIQFEKGKNKNTCIITVDESRIDPTNIKYMYNKLIPEEREIIENEWESTISNEDVLEYMGCW